MFLAPGVFELHGEDGLLCATTVPDDQEERVRQAAAACPVQVRPARRRGNRRCPLT
ncbi:ferredoxin [Streptomyces adustus]|uniref:ferredoxin n=1 Tax=Streptomyces adustus TaxID=1609272 RepID=UPI00371D5A39